MNLKELRKIKEKIKELYPDCRVGLTASDNIIVTGESIEDGEVVIDSVTVIFKKQKDIIRPL